MPYHCQPRFARRAAFTPFSGLEVLNGLISALDDKPTTSRCAVPTARPNFDVYETKDSYVLEAELPGVSDKQSIELQFTDAQTLSVKGAIGRRPRREAPQEQASADVEKATATINEKSDAEMSDATLDNESVVEGLVRKGSPAPSYHATVEDDEEGDDFEVVHTPRTNTPGPIAGGPAADEKQQEATPAAAAAPAAGSEEAAKVTAKERCRRRCASGRRYWVSERSTGVFHRTFSFSGLVDQDAVKANLENGLLTIVVPKRQPSITRVNIE